MAMIKKTFSGIGEVEYKIASSKKELEGALSLVYNEYLLRGYILPKYYKSGLRITLQNVLPGTTVFIVLKDKEVIGAVTLIPDSLLGLPMDQVYKKEVDGLRKGGRKVCEIGQMAVKSGLFGRGFFSMYNFKKLNFVFSLFKLAFQYAAFFAKFDDMCIVTNPKLMIFRFLPFSIMGKVKYYGYDRVAIKKKAAVAKRIDLRTIEERTKKRYGIHKMYLGSRIPQEVFEQRYVFKPADLHYFFVEKSDIFKKAKKQQKEYVRSCYGLNEEEFNRLLAGKV